MEIPYEQTGLKISNNSGNKFCVIRLHYTADPRKRSPEWKREAHEGLRPADWAKEYEIDYTALSGERVFPEIAEARNTIVVDEPYPEFDSNQQYWGGLDYGMRNPSSLHYYTIYDGVWYAIWELYEPCRDVQEFVRKAKEFPYYDKVRYIACDPTMYNTTQRNSLGLPCSPYELFVKAGFSKLLKGRNDEQVWLMQMRNLWSDLEDPTFRIFNRCPKMISEFENAVYQTIGEKVSQTHNMKEKMVDKANHAMDDCKYLFSTRPSGGPFTEVKWPRLVDTYRIR